MLKLSSGERKFLIDGVQQGLRNDGRGNMDYRHFTIETGIVSQTNGSSRMKLGDNTDVLVGIKLETGEPDLNSPKEGKIQLSVECCPSASPEFEGNGGDELNAELTSVLERILLIDRKQLCILPGKLCWILYVDAMVFDTGGNLFDAISIATRAALYNTQVPVVQVDEENEEYEVTDDFKKLDISDVPMCITFTKIGRGYVVDATLEEEECMTVRMTIAVNKRGRVTAIQKGGHGGIEPSAMFEMLNSARRIGTQILSKLDETLPEEEAQQQKMGFFL